MFYFAYEYDSDRVYAQKTKGASCVSAAQVACAEEQRKALGRFFQPLFRQKIVLLDTMLCYGRLEGKVGFAECREQIKLWWIILAIILAILLIGIILLLIWKCCATLIDRREFAKFEKERQNAKWDTVRGPRGGAKNEAQLVRGRGRTLGCGRVDRQQVRNA